MIPVLCTFVLEERQKHAKSFVPTHAAPYLRIYLVVAVMMPKRDLVECE